MHQLLFEGIGTHWKVLYFLPSNLSDSRAWKTSLKKKIITLVHEFDNNYSRFIVESLVWKFAKSKKPQHKISKEFSDILKYGKELMELTNGQFNPAVGRIFENIGYDTKYSFKEKSVKSPVYLKWSVEGSTLKTPKPVLIDIGGWGKGYLIDLVAKLLKKEGIKHFLVDGGGDVYATDKPGEIKWKVALEHPKISSQAFGMVELSHMAMASTGSNKRAFGKHHHLVDATKGKSVNNILGMHTQARTATQADGAATALFVDGLKNTDSLSKKLGVEYLGVSPSLKYKKSNGFVGNIFDK